MGELLTLSPLLQAFLAALMTWGLTALGAALVIFTHRLHALTLDAMLAFGAGVMLASSYWSLLSPAIELAGVIGQSPFLAAAAGFLCGGLLVLIGVLMAVPTKSPVRRLCLSTTSELCHRRE